MNQQPKIIDGDGHIFEDGEAIARHFPYSAAGGGLEMCGARLVDWLGS